MDIFIPTFRAALFTAAKRWKQPKCPFVDELRNKMQSIHTMEYYSALKRKEGSSVVVWWLRLHLPMQGVQVQSLVREQRSHILWSVVKKWGKKIGRKFFLYLFYFWHHIVCGISVPHLGVVPRQVSAVSTESQLVDRQGIPRKEIQTQVTTWINLEDIMLK